MSGHAPVMEREAIAALAPRDGGVYVDGTLGGGGYTRAILAAANCRVVAFDRDPAAIERAQGWAQAYGDRLRLVGRPFGDLEQALRELNIEAIDGAVFDLGVSSMQLDEAERGFSFRADGPLSMRMDGGKPDAADVVARAEADDLVGIFKVYGEEKNAGRLARAIVRARDDAPIETTARLAAVIEAAQPRRPQDRIHPATRVFQGLRIFVNDELGELVRALHAAERMLAPAGRLVVVTFHSLEDRIVKRFFAARIESAAGRASRHAPVAPLEAAATLRLLTTKAAAPSAAEIADNPRARSAKLRVGVRTGAPAGPDISDNLLTRPRLSKAMNFWSDAA